MCLRHNKTAKKYITSCVGFVGTKTPPCPLRARSSGNRQALIVSHGPSVFPLTGDSLYRDAVDAALPS